MAGPLRAVRRKEYLDALHKGNSPDLGLRRNLLGGLHSLVSLDWLSSFNSPPSTISETYGRRLSEMRPPSACRNLEILSVSDAITNATFYQDTTLRTVL